MGICSDKSVNYLRRFGYSVVRQPSAEITPLLLVGQYKDAIGLIGTVDQLVEPQAGLALPAFATDIAAANVSGQSTSKLPIDLSISILKDVLQALGGDLGISAKFSRARSLEFTFQNVKKDQANLIKVGDFLSAGKVRWNQIILKKYLFGSGRLFVITETLKTSKFTVTATADNGAGLEVDVPTIQQIASGKFNASYEGTQKNVVTFEGTQPLTFGFKAVEFSAVEDDRTHELALSFEPTEPGSVTLGLDGAPHAAIFQPAGAIERLVKVAPEELGEG